MKLLGLQTFLVFFQDNAVVAIPDDGTDVTETLNGLIGASTDGGVYTGGKGVIVRAPDFITSGDGKVVPGSFWSNDIVAPSQMYPTRGNIWFPNTGWDGYGDITFQTTDLPDGIWTYASVGAVIGTSLNLLYPNDFDNIQAEDWGWGVFYAKDSNAADQRCQRWDEYGGWDCQGGWLNDNGDWEDDNIHKGSADYYAGNPAALGGPSAGFGGGAGCHFDSNWKAIDQPDASGPENLVGNANCECNYDLSENGWGDWYDVFVNNLQQKAAYAPDRTWLGGTGDLMPAWAMDATICWVSNPRDLIQMQNQFYWNRGNWNNQMVPSSDWSQGTPDELRKYWGWNEIPVDRDVAEDPNSWDAVLIKLPAAICGTDAMGGDDSLFCLGGAEAQAVEDDLDSFVNSGKLNPGWTNVGSRPGSYVVLVREYARIWEKSSTADEGKLGAKWQEYDWQRYFFCENWQSPNGKYQIVHMTPSEDPNGRGACYIEWGGVPTPPPAPAASGTIEHLASGKCLAVPDGDLFNGNTLIVTTCDGSNQQNWYFDNSDWTLRNGDNSGMCVDAPDGGLWKGNGMEVWECNGFDGQKFGYDGSTIYASSSSDASLCFDVVDGGNEDGDMVWLWDCYGGDNQAFKWNQQQSSLFVA